ncbi:glycosyltransferase family 87 protein, partial [Magnetospirillum fulvum]
MSKAIWSGFVDRIYDVKAFSAYQLDLQGGKSSFILPNFYPPSFLFFVLPLSLGPFLVMAHVWIFGTLALFATLGQGRRWSGRRALVLLAAPSTMVTMAAGQTGFLTAALLGGGLGLLRTHPVAAGVCLGLVTIKPHLALLAGVALLAARAWRAILAAALTFATLAGLSAAAFGPELWLDWVRVLPQAWEMNLAAFDRLGGFMPTLTGALLKLGTPLAVAKTAQTLA